MRCRYSIAETLTTPFLKRALVTLPYYKEVDPQHIAKEKGLKRILQWFQVHCEPIAKHALNVATWIIQGYRAHCVKAMKICLLLVQDHLGPPMPGMHCGVVISQPRKHKI